MGCSPSVLLDHIHRDTSASQDKRVIKKHPTVQCANNGKKAGRSLLKLSTPSIRNAQGPSVVGKTSSPGYLADSGANNILPKVQHLEVPNLYMDHGLFWTFERMMAVSLLGITSMTVLAPSTVMDDIFAICVIIYDHWRVEAIVFNFVRPAIFGETIPKILVMACYLFSATLLGGLLYFNHNDIGIGKAIKKLWSLCQENSESTVEGQ